MMGAARGYAREAVHAAATSRPSASASCARTAPSWCSPIRWKAPTARFARCGSSTPTIRRRTSTPTSTATRRTGARTTTRPVRRLLAQTDGAITHFVAGLGTSGTFMGAGRLLPRARAARAADLRAARDRAARARGPEAHGVGHRPADLRSGAGRRGSSARAPKTRTRSRGGWRPRKGCSSASRAARRSSVGLRVAARLDAGVVVMIFCDGGEKYLSERFWEEPPEGSFVGGVN